MKTTSLDATVLTGQGGCGSFSVGVSNPAPGVGSQGGGTDADLAPAVASPAVVAAINTPNNGIESTPGPLNEPQSLYSVPVQKG